MTKKLKTQKFYAYVDKTWIEEKIFIVSVVILTNSRARSLEKLQKIETSSKKGKIKWHKAYYKFNQQYIKTILVNPIFKQTLFFEIFYFGTDDLKLTADTTSRAILKKISKLNDYQIRIYLDGYNKTEIKRFQKAIKPFNIKIKKISGIKNENSNAFIRLADAICGLVRQAEKNKKWAKDILQKLRKKKIITKL